MPIALDHIVQTVADLEAACAGLESIGLRTVPGGRHAHWGTHNALCHLGLTYIELLAIEDRAVAEGSTFGRAVIAEEARGDGIWRLAMRTGDIMAVVGKARAAGIRCNGPVPGYRERPDGSVLRWSLAFLEMPDADFVPPMLIDWHETDRLRMADLVARGIAGPSPRAVVGGIAIACRDPEETAEWMRKAFGLVAHETATRSYGEALRISLRGGDILLCGGPSAPPAVQAAHALRGERPFAVHLSAGDDTDGEVRIGGALYTHAAL